MPKFASQERSGGPLPADDPREPAGWFSFVPWWLPTWVILVSCVGVIGIGAAMLVVLRLPM